MKTFINKHQYTILNCQFIFFFPSNFGYDGDDGYDDL